MELKELVKRINGSDEWNPEDLKELCTMAGMVEEWKNSDGENFEEVVYQAAERLGVDISGGVAMFKLIEKNEGKEKIWVTGTLTDIIKWLKNNPDIYTWISDEDPEAELPDLDQVENLRDLRHELKKADLSWWSLTIIMEDNSMKNFLVETNADTQIWVTKGDQVVVFSEYDLWKVLLKPTKKLLSTIGSFDEVVANNNNELEVYNIADLDGKVLAEYSF